MLRKLSLFISSFAIFMSSILCHSTCAADDNTCTFGDETFQPGDNLGDAFLTRCGRDYPCFCQPDSNPPVDCPYCGIATQTSGLVCTRLGETVDIVNLQGDAQTCRCLVDPVTGLAETQCTTSVPASPVSAPSPPTPNDICILEWADGSTMEFQNGESFGDFFPSPCTSDPYTFPCYCNTKIEGKLECPFCVLEPSQDNNEDVVCLVANQEASTQDDKGRDVDCTCLANYELQCVVAGSPTPFPTLRPTTQIPTSSPILLVDPTPPPVPPVPPSPMTLSPAVAPIFAPRPTPPPNNDKPPVVVIEPPTFDKPSILVPNRPNQSPVMPRPPSNPPNPGIGCIYPDIQTGITLFTTRGQVLPQSSLWQGPCTPLDDYPPLCQPDLPLGVEYPYCVFGTSLDDDFLVCAQSGQRVSVPTPDGQVESCSCLYLNPQLGPVSSCPHLLLSVDLQLPTWVPSVVPSTAPTIPVPTVAPMGNDDDDATSSSGAITTTTTTIGGWHFLLLVVGWVEMVAGWW